MKLIFVLLALQVALVAAGTYDDIKQQIKDLVQSSGSSGSSGDSNKYVEDEGDQPVTGKIRGFFSKMMDKVKSVLPGGKKKSDEEAPITLNDYTQEKHLHFHRDHHIHREKHRHISHSKNLYDGDNYFPSSHDQYRFKRDGQQKKKWTKDDFLALLKKVKADSKKKREEAAKKVQKPAAKEAKKN